MFILINQNFREIIHIFNLNIYISNIKLYSTVSAKKQPKLFNTNIEIPNLYIYCKTD